MTRSVTTPLLVMSRCMLAEIDATNAGSPVKPTRQPSRPCKGSTAAWIAAIHAMASL